MRKIFGVLLASVLIPAALPACQGDTPAGAPGASADYPAGGGVNSDRAARFDMDRTSQSARGGGPQYTPPPPAADNNHPLATPTVTPGPADQNARGATPGAPPANANNAAMRPESTSNDWGDPQIAATLGAVDSVEIKEGNLAVRMAHSPAVRQFARMMVQHHTADEASARRLFGRVHIDPSPNAATDHVLDNADHTINRLSGMQGDAFDRAYMENAVQDHQTVLNLIDQHMVPTVHQQELHTLVLNTVRPMVMAHLAHAQRIQSDLFNHGGTGNGTGPQGTTPAQAQQRP